MDQRGAPHRRVGKIYPELQASGNCSGGGGGGEARGPCVWAVGRRCMHSDPGCWAFDSEATPDGADLGAFQAQGDVATGHRFAPLLLQLTQTTRKRRPNNNLTGLDMSGSVCVGERGERRGGAHGAAARPPGTNRPKWTRPISPHSIRSIPKQFLHTHRQTAPLSVDVRCQVRRRIPCTYVGPGLLLTGHGRCPSTIPTTVRARSRRSQ